jgi:hypothetical protein
MKKQEIDGYWLIDGTGGKGLRQSPVRVQGNRFGGRDLRLLSAFRQSRTIGIYKTPGSADFRRFFGFLGFPFFLQCFRRFFLEFFLDFLGLHVHPPQLGWLIVKPTVQRLFK